MIHQNAASCRCPQKTTSPSALEFRAELYFYNFRNSLRVHKSIRPIGISSIFGGPYHHVIFIYLCIYQKRARSGAPLGPIPFNLFKTKMSKQFTAPRARLSIRRIAFIKKTLTIYRTIQMILFNSMTMNYE